MSDQSTDDVIETDSLRLIPCRMEHVEAIERGPHELGLLLNISVHKDWPVFPETMGYVAESLKSDPAGYRWGFYLFVHAGDRVLIGEGGFKGRPDAESLVEIGYAIVPEYRRRGLAYEAAKGLTDHAFSHPSVKVVQAHTLKDGTASIRVLEKLGMKLVGTAEDPDEGEVLQWRMDKDSEQ